MTGIVTYARPNLNGNEPSQFMRTAKELLDAAQDAKNVIQKDVSECFHGRNYQFQQDSLRKRDADMALVQELHRDLDRLIDFALALARSADAPAEDLPTVEAAE